MRPAGDFRIAPRSADNRFSNACADALAIVGYRALSMQAGRWPFFRLASNAQRPLDPTAPAWNESGPAAGGPCRCDVRYRCGVRGCRMRRNTPSDPVLSGGRLSDNGCIDLAASSFPRIQCETGKNAWIQVAWEPIQSAFLLRKVGTSKSSLSMTIPLYSRHKSLPGISLAACWRRMKVGRSNSALRARSAGVMSRTFPP